jgi:hypothetical protein
MSTPFIIDIFSGENRALALELRPSRQSNSQSALRFGDCAAAEVMPDSVPDRVQEGEQILSGRLPERLVSGRIEALLQHGRAARS